MDAVACLLAALLWAQGGEAKVQPPADPSLGVRVVDVDCQPVAGAQVELAPAAAGASGEKPARARQGVTDGDGVVRFPGLIEGDYLARARDSLGRTGERKDPLTGERRPYTEVVLAQRQPLELTLQLPEKGKYRTLDLSLTPEDFREHRCLRPVEVAVDPGPDGRVVLPAVAAGRWILSVDLLQLGPSATSSVALAIQVPGAVAPIELRRGLEIRGRVEDPAGKPREAQGAARRVRCREGGCSSYGWHRTHQVSPREDGTFVVRGVDGGEWRLTLSQGGRRAEVIAKGGEEDVLLRLPGPAPLRVEGRAVGADGAPLAGAELEAEHREIDQPVTAKADAQGRFSLQLDPGFAWTVRAVHGGRKSPRVAVAKSGALTVAMHRGASVRLRLLDPEGKPLLPRILTSRWERLEAKQLPDGTARIEDAVPGADSWRLEVKGLGTLVAAVEVRDGEELDLGELRMQKPARVRGKVQGLDRRGDRRHAIRFLLDRVPGENVAGGWVEGEEFETAPQQPGRYLLTVRREVCDSPGEDLREVVLAPGETRELSMAVVNR
jgi:protocatechuate 3,4-dioxygenase beta subunit